MEFPFWAAAGDPVPLHGHSRVEQGQPALPELLLDPWGMKMPIQSRIPGRGRSPRQGRSMESALRSQLEQEPHEEIHKSLGKQELVQQDRRHPQDGHSRGSPKRDMEQSRAEAEKLLRINPGAPKQTQQILGSSQSQIHRISTHSRQGCYSRASSQVVFQHLQPFPIPLLGALHWCPPLEFAKIQCLILSKLQLPETSAGCNSSSSFPPQKRGM